VVIVIIIVMLGFNMLMASKVPDARLTVNH